jgi:hypothetical protein
MIDNRTMVDRPNRRPFLGVAYGLRAGVHSVVAGRPLPVGRRTRGAARRAHAAEWSTPAGIRWEGAGWCGPIIKPATHLQPTRVGQTLTEAGPGCARIDGLGPTAPVTGYDTFVCAGDDIDQGPTVRWCVDRFRKAPTFPGNFLYGRQKNCHKLNVSLVFLSTRCASVI